MITEDFNEVPGHDIIESGERFFPVRLEGGYVGWGDDKGRSLHTTPTIFDDDGPKLSAYTFDDGHGHTLWYGNKFAAENFLRKWVRHNGGMKPFEAAWADHLASERTLAEPSGTAERAYRYVSLLFQRLADKTLDLDQAINILGVFSHEGTTLLPPEMTDVYIAAWDMLKSLKD